MDHFTVVCLAFEWKWGYSWPCVLHWPYFSPEVMKLTKRVWKGTLHDTSSSQNAYMHELVVILDQHNWLCCFSCSVLRSDVFSIIILDLNGIKSKHKCNTNNYQADCKSKWNKNFSYKEIGYLLEGGGFKPWKILRARRRTNKLKPCIVSCPDNK